MRQEKDRSSKEYPNPHCPRYDGPGKEEKWLEPSPLDYYTSATDCKPAFKTEPMSPKQQTEMFGKVS